MLTREDFYKILANTVTAYYRTVHNREVVFSYEKADNCEKLIINGKLGFISRFPAATGLRKFLLAEYNVRGNRLKYAVGKAAALAGSALPQIGKIRTAYISRGALGQNAFISPQNRSVRFFDYDAMTVDCIIKDGFTEKYFSNQLAFRKQYQYDFMLPLLDSGERWFREPILTGHPLARVTDEEKYKQCITAALRGIRQLAEDTMTFVSLAEYTQGLLAHIETLVREAAERKKIRFAEQTLSMARKAVEADSRCDMQVPLCVTHGDFQGGNIWMDETGKTWLYDWETSGIRSVWYDSAVLCYSLRRAYGWTAFLEDRQPREICNCDPEKTHSAEEYETIKRIVLLEDIVFYLEDMLELPENWGTQIYDSFAGRMWELLKER